MRHILNQQIKPPMLMFAPPTDAGATTDAGPTTFRDMPKETTITKEVVDDGTGKEVEIEVRGPGEAEPDFSALDGDDAQIDENASSAPDGGKAPEKKEKPATEPPDTKKEALKEVEAGEIPKEEKPEPAAKAAETAKAEVKAIPADDSDLDAIQPKPGSNPKIKNDFDRLREAAKEARNAQRAEVERIKGIEAAKIELEAKLTATKPITPEMEKEIAELRDYRARIELEHDPIVQKEFSEKMTKADESMFALLAANGMTEDQLKIMREKGIDSYNSAWWKREIFDNLSDDPIAKRKIEDAIMGREAVKTAKNERVAAISKDKDKFTAEREEKQKAQWTDFGKKVDAKATELCKDKPWATKIEVTDKMSAQEKAAAEAHNLTLVDQTKEFVATVTKAINYDPEAIAEMAFAKLHNARLAEEYATATKQLETANARIAELEGEIAAVTRSGKVSEKSGAPAKAATVTKPTIGQSADEAFDAYMDGKGS